MRKFPASFEQNIEFWWAFRKIQGTSSTQSVTKVENKHKTVVENRLMATFQWKVEQQQELNQTYRHQRQLSLTFP